MAGPRAYAIGLDELQRRLKKLHDEKDLIVNLLDHMVKKMDLLVAHVSSLTNVNQFLCYFMDATSTMERMYMKLFKIHVLLTEDTYVDAEQQRVPHMAITYAFHASSDQNSNSQLAVLEAKDRLSCLPPVSQHSSSAHLSICDEMLGRQTPAANFALQQETAAAISSLTAAYARLTSGSPLKAPTYDIPSGPAALAPTCSTTPFGETYAATAPVAMHVPTVPAPTVPAPTVPAPTVPAPTVPAATLRTATLRTLSVPSTVHGVGLAAPIIPALSVRAPSAPRATMLSAAARAPAVPPPAVHVPAAPASSVAVAAVRPCGLSPNHGATCSETYSVCSAVAPTALVHSSAVAPPSQALNHGQNICSAEYADAAVPRSITPSPATPGPAAPSFTTAATLATSLEATKVPAVKPPVKQPSAEAVGAVSPERTGSLSSDQGGKCCYKEEDNQNKQAKPGPCAPTQSNPTTPVLPTQSQGGPNGVPSDNSAAKPNFQQQKQPMNATKPCGNPAAQQHSKSKPLEVPLPNADVVGTTQDIVLSFYKTPSEFWIQLTSASSTLEDILKRLHECYSTMTQRREFIAKPGMYCAAYYTEDGHWYRARILQVLKDHAKVFYVDFGNSDRVDLDYLCFLEEEFASLPAQALCCSIKNVKRTCGPGMWSITAVRAFRNKISSPGTKLQARFHSQDIVTGRYIVDILSVNKDHAPTNLSEEFISVCSSGYLIPTNQKAVNSVAKLPVSSVVTASKATSPAMTAMAVLPSTTTPPVGPSPTTPTSTHTVPLPGMFRASMPSTSIPSTRVPSVDTLPCNSRPASSAPVCTPELGVPLAGPPSAGMPPHSVGITPPTAGKAPPPTGMGPPPAGMSPPPAGMGPPPAAMGPPPAGMSPPPAGMGPPPAAMGPPPAAMGPPPAAMGPPPAGMGPPPAGMGPPPAAMGPPPTGMGPPPVGMAPFPAGMVPPPARMAPPPAGMVPPPAWTAPPPAGMVPNAGGMAPPPTGMVPPPAGTAPPPAGMVPPPAGTAPPPAGMVPPPAGTAPPPAGMVPNAAGMAPPPAGMVPPSTGMVPPPTGIVPPPAGMAPPPTGTTSPPTAMASHTAGLSPSPPDMSPALPDIATSLAGMAASPAAAEMVSTTMASAPVLPGGMQSLGMCPTTLLPAYPQVAGTTPSVIVPPAILPEGNTFCVCLSVVFNPSDFYGQIVDDANPTVKVLEELQQKLNICGSQSVAPVEEMVTKGSFWICEFQGDRNWYRAQVLDVLPGSDSPRYRVLYVDYGNRSTVTCPCLRPLPLELACLPACAHRMSLAFLGPKQGNKWDESATGVFVKETGFNVSLIAEKKGHRRSGFEDITEVVLWNRNGPTSVNINVVLVEQGVALLKPTERELVH